MGAQIQVIRTFLFASSLGKLLGAGDRLPSVSSFVDEGPRPQIWASPRAGQEAPRGGGYTQEPPSTMTEWDGREVSLLP